MEEFNTSVKIEDVDPLDMLSEVVHEALSNAALPPVGVEKREAEEIRSEPFVEQFSLVEVKMEPEDPELKRWSAVIHSEHFLNVEKLVDSSYPAVMIDNEHQPGTSKDDPGKDVQKHQRSSRSPSMKIKKKFLKSGIVSSKRKSGVKNDTSVLQAKLQREPPTGNISPHLITEDEEREVKESQRSSSTIQKSAATLYNRLFKSKKEQNTFDSNLKKMLSRNQNQQQIEDDPDRMFLLSLLPHFKSLTPDCKMLAQKEIIRTIHRLLKTSENSLTDLGEPSPSTSSAVQFNDIPFVNDNIPPTPPLSESMDNLVPQGSSLDKS